MSNSFKAKITLTDDLGQMYEGEVELTKSVGKRTSKTRQKSTDSAWYKKGSTIAKIIKLVAEGFFDKNRTISDIVDELKAKDYHLKQSDLTLPLRKTVRKEILKRTKDFPDGTKSKQWTYIKP